MKIVVASEAIKDEDFLKMFHACVLPLEMFKHGDHLRLAWLELHRRSFEEALASVRFGIQRFAAHYGVAHIFHETVTIAWVQLLATHSEASFAEFLCSHTERIELGLLEMFWTTDLLNSPAARSGWVAPNRRALPA